jgi:hypothetical protein
MNAIHFCRFFKILLPAKTAAVYAVNRARKTYSGEVTVSGYKGYRDVKQLRRAGLAANFLSRKTACRPCVLTGTGLLAG